MEPEQHPAQSNLKEKFIWGILLFLSLIAILSIAGRYFNIQQVLISALEWIDRLGFWKIVAFIVIYNLATVLFIPGSILTLGGGAIFGVIWGSIYVFIAATLGATFAFLIGRYLARNWVAKQIEANPKFQAIDKAVAKEGLKIVFLTRLSPVFPFNLLNYAFGVTQVSLRDYFLGSIGMIPGTIMYVYFGSLVGNITMLGKATQFRDTQAEVAKLLIQVLGFIATVAVTIYITRIARKALEDSVS